MPPPRRPPRGQQRKSFTALPFRAVNMKARRCPRSAVSNKNRACNCIASVLQPQSGRDVKAQVAAQLYEEALSRPVRAFFGSRLSTTRGCEAAPRAIESGPYRAENLACRPRRALRGPRLPRRVGPGTDPCPRPTVISPAPTGRDPIAQVAAQRRPGIPAPANRPQAPIGARQIIASVG